MEDGLHFSKELEKLKESINKINDLNDIFCSEKCIGQLFQSLIQTMVMTIERRDPITSGHSVRVANYAIRLAKAIDRVNYGKYRKYNFTDEEIQEIYYAALLHDIGKIGINENILTKKNKISSLNMELIEYRFAYIKNELKLKKINNNINENQSILLNKIDDYYQFIEQLNTKECITKCEICIAEEIHNKKICTPKGNIANLITANELENITVLKGNLTIEERKIMNLHPIYTYEILKIIPWIKSLSKIPQITLQHHEKLDGSGYPNGLTNSKILIQSRILTISDIFEALTAEDRPYKKGFSKEKALEIIKNEVDLGKLDKNIFEIFVNEKIYK